MTPAAPAHALSAGMNGERIQSKSAMLSTYVPFNGDLEEGGISGSPGRVKEQGG